MQSYTTYALAYPRPLFIPLFGAVSLGRLVRSFRSLARIACGVHTLLFRVSHIRGNLPTNRRGTLFRIHWSTGKRLACILTANYRAESGPPALHGVCRTGNSLDRCNLDILLLGIYRIRSWINEQSSWVPPATARMQGLTLNFPFGKIISLPVANICTRSRRSYIVYAPSFKHLVRETRRGTSGIRILKHRLCRTARA